MSKRECFVLIPALIHTNMLSLIVLNCSGVTHRCNILKMYLNEIFVGRTKWSFRLSNLFA